MPFVHVDGADIFYSEYGQSRKGRPPVLLIHGAPNSGGFDWNVAAPLLARGHHVIVPDCRGHGKSANPANTYSFKEMAADFKALLQTLGHAKAHVIGHSNGGNVALVMLMAFPEIVQTAVLQAANAFVSQDLIDEQPGRFDPDRIIREQPERVDEWNAQHARTHGSDYWRTLVRLMVAELISQPNFTPDDLAKVRQPVLVIQGELDQVNARSLHGQFIARNVPDAELWTPEGIGHNVHKEITYDWVGRVEDFLRRRGSEANNAIHLLKQAEFPDARQTVFDVSAKVVDTGGVEITGRVLEESQRHRVNGALSGFGPVADRVTVLLRDDTPRALVKLGLTDIRKKPANMAERMSQALVGESVRILDESGTWALVRLDRDGYIGWIHQGALCPCGDKEFDEFQSAKNALVSARLADCFPDPAKMADKNGVVPFGATVCIMDHQGEFVRVGWPGGRTVWLRESDVTHHDQMPKADEEGIRTVLDMIRRFIGVPYLWGGLTPFGYDCSGLAQIFTKWFGLSLPRDSDQQIHHGAPIHHPGDSDWNGIHPGDLMFFGYKADEERCQSQKVTHVGISLGGARFIHANATVWSVSINNMDPNSDTYRPWLDEHYLGARRVLSP